MATPKFLTSLFSRLQSLNPFDTPQTDFEYPIVADVLATKAILLQCSLPLELIDRIIDYAEYWPHTSAPSILSASARNSDYFITRTLPLGCLPSSPSTNSSLAPERVKDGIPKLYPFPPTQSKASKTATAALFAAWTRLSRPRDTHPCRKIVFRFASHDQGWGGDYENRGTYSGSYTWLDVGKEKARVVDENEELERSIERLRRGPGNWEAKGGVEVEQTLKWNVESVDPPLEQGAKSAEEGGKLNEIGLGHPFLPHDKTLQKNRSATDQPEQYTIIWRWDDNIDPESADADALEDAGRGRATGNGEFVRSLEIGDVVTLWARARFRGWVNTVENIHVDMFWAV